MKHQDRYVRDDGMFVMNGEALTVAEVAAYLKVSKVTVKRWCSRKKLPAFKIGREWRIDKKEFELMIQRSGQEPDEVQESMP